MAFGKTAKQRRAKAQALNQVNALKRATKRARGGITVGTSKPTAPKELMKYEVIQ